MAFYLEIPQELAHISTYKQIGTTLTSLIPIYGVQALSNYFNNVYLEISRKLLFYLSFTISPFRNTIISEKNATKRNF